MILGLDLSTKSTGWAILDNGKLQDYGCLTATSADVVERIKKIVGGLKEILEGYKGKIDKIVIEEVRPATDWGTNMNTVHALNWMQGYTVVMLHDVIGAEVEFALPNSWRSDIGIKTGRGVKRETLKAKDIEWVKNRYGIDVNDDIADAIGLASSKLKLTAW